jgi:hypothetical protein
MEACTYAGAIGAVLLRQQCRQQNVDSQAYLDVLEVVEITTTSLPDGLAPRRGLCGGCAGCGMMGKCREREGQDRRSESERHFVFHGKSSISEIGASGRAAPSTENDPEGYCGWCK